MKGKRKAEAKEIKSVCEKKYRYCDECECLKLDEGGKWNCSEGKETYLFEDFEKEVEKFL